MPWIVLVLSGVLEAVWAVALGRSDGFTKLTPTVVFGVALDYCVKAAALGLEEWLGRRNREGEVWLIEEATAAVDPLRFDATLATLAEAHVKIRTMNDVHRVITREAQTRAALHAPSTGRVPLAPQATGPSSRS